MYCDDISLQVSVTTTVLFIGDEGSDVGFAFGVNENHKSQRRNIGIFINI